MDENVVFNNAQNKSGEPDPNAAASSADATSVDPNAAADPNVVADESAIADPNAPAEASVDQSTTEEPLPQTPPPPPGGIGGFLAGKKKLLIGLGILLLIIIIIIILLPKSSTPKNITLVWWGLWEDSRTVEGIISDFERQHPNITIKYEKQNPQKYRSRLITRVGNGQNAPDIYRYHNTWVPMLTEAKVLLPLSSDVITPQEFKKVYYPVMQKDLVVNGAIYGIPLGADTIAMFVNPQLLEAQNIEVPRNWDDFTKAVAKLTVIDPDTKKIKTAGTALGTYGNVSHAPDIVAMLFAQQTTKDPNKVITDQAAALKFYTAFSTGLATGDPPVWESSLDESKLAFSKGNLAIYFGYSWDIFHIQSLNKDLQFKVYTVPGLPGKEQSIASYWVEGVSANSQNKEAALLFMHYLAQKETAEKFYEAAAKGRAFGEPYARVDLGDTLKDNELVYPFVSQLNNASSSYFASDTADGEGGINTLVNTYLENAINSIIFDGTSPDTVAKTLNEGVTQVLSKYGIQAAGNP